MNIFAIAVDLQRYADFIYFCNDHHNFKMNNSAIKASVPNVQVYAANDPKSHSHLCERHHQYNRS